MDIKDIVVGTTYKIRSWANMAEEYGLNSRGNIDPQDGSGAVFTRGMADLCGILYTPELIDRDGFLYPFLGDICYMVTPFMLEPVAETAPQKRELGMYEIADPTYPQVKVGQFTICRQDATSVWICCEDGEGGQFSDDLFEAALKEFYNKHF